MRVNVLGAAVWGRGLCDYADLERVVAAGRLDEDAEFIAPKPEAIPPRERRRAGLMINLAVTVAHQACEHAGVDKSQVPSVFVSSMGDTDITDYMCRKLAQPDKLLSPTKFHNSVHNAPSGYWTISAENRAPSSFVGGYDHSFGAGLLEAVSQVQASNQAVLLVVYDIENRQPFTDVSPIRESFGAGLVLGPPQARSERAGIALQMQLALQPDFSVAGGSRDDAVMTPDLAELAAHNPSAASLGLLEQIVYLGSGERTRAELTIPAATRLGLHLTLTPRA